MKKDELMSLLNKKRDFIVHRGMLEVLSHGNVGATEGRIIKISSGFQVAPYESTVEAYERFIPVSYHFFSEDSRLTV
jgi:hypothetical protein